MQRVVEGHRPAHPWHHRPCVWEVLGRTSNPDCRGYRDWKFCRKLWEPLLLMFNQLGGHLASRNTQGELLANAEDHVVPTLRCNPNILSHQVGVLGGKQAFGQGQVNVNVCRWWCHRKRGYPGRFVQASGEGADMVA